jgi:hypothetical protein
MGRGNFGKRGNGGPPPEQQVQFPITKEIVYRAVDIRVKNLEDGSRSLIILDPTTATAHVVPMNADAARAVGNALASAISIATPGEVPDPPAEAA